MSFKMLLAGWFFPFFLLGSFSSVVFAQSNELTAGIAVVDITPPIGYRMSGYFSERLSTGIHDPLYAKAMVLQQGNIQAVLVFCDIVGVPLGVSQRARQLAQEKTGIPAANIVIAATHSHTGPLYAGALRNYLHETTIAKEGKDTHESIDYPAFLIDKIVAAVTGAKAAAAPVSLTAGIAGQSNLSFNRRFHMKDGTVRFNPGVLNPDIDHAAGPIDPDLAVVLLRDASDNQTKASLVNFALHLDTTGGTLYSADFPYYLEQALRRKLGDNFVSLFAIGTCGDINHIDVTTKDRRKAEEIGNILAQTVGDEIPRLSPIAHPDLAISHEIVNAPLQKYSPQEVEQARQDMTKLGTKQLTFLEIVNAYKILDLQLRPGETIPLEVQVLRLSDDVVLVALPGEIFVDLGLAIKKASPFKTTIVMELCNDNPGYIPTKKAFAEGSYETVNSRITAGGGEMLVASTVRQLQAIKKMPLPGEEN